MSRFLLLMLLSFLAFHKVNAQKIDEIKEADVVKQVIKNYEDAWNVHDAKKLAEQYHTDAAWVNWFGAYSKGRKEIQQHYQTIHGAYYKNSKYYTRSIEDLTFVKPDVVIAHVRTGLSGDERYPGQTFEHRRTIVLTKREGIWRILAGQNAKLGEGVK